MEREIIIPFEEHPTYWWWKDEWVKYKKWCDEHRRD